MMLDDHTGTPKRILQKGAKCFRASSHYIWASQRKEMEHILL
jgi:hypothetical protein